MPSVPKFSALKRPGVAAGLVGVLVALTFLLQTFTGQSSSHHITRRIDQRANAGQCGAELQARNSADIDDIVRLALLKAAADQYVEPLADLQKVEDQLRHLDKSCPE